MKLDIFYALKDCPQRKFGYSKIYDETAPLFNMIMDCEPITFLYEGRQWLIELWKGQYGITTGAEVGIYSAEIKEENLDFSDTFYESIKDEEMMPMSLTLCKNGEVLFKRTGKHWWMTGFVLGEFSEKDELKANIRIKFPTRKMCAAFVEALYKTGYKKDEVNVLGTSVSVKYGVPKTAQPISYTSEGERFVQMFNENNCRIFNKVTEKYINTLDKIEYIMALEPYLSDILVKSLGDENFYAQRIN